MFGISDWICVTKAQSVRAWIENAQAVETKATPKLKRKVRQTKQSLKIHWFR